MDADLRAAIAGKRLIELDYNGLHRVAEPHVYGALRGKAAVLTFQTEGESSSGGLPQWRRFDVPLIENLRVLDRAFPGPRPYPSGKHSSFDVTWAFVQ